jgi:hypothetical protein
MSRWVSYRAALCAAFVSAFTFCVTASAGANDFGARYLNNQKEYGDISSIKVPTAGQQPPNSHALYAHRSVVQSDLAASAGLVQSGWLTAGSNVQVDNCGNTDSGTNDYVEYRPVSGTFLCYIYTNWPSGTDYNFNVFVNSSGWNVKIDGNLDPDGPWHIGAAYGYPIIGGESAVSSGTAKAYACYGEGASSWNYYDAPTNGGAGSILVSPNSATSTVLSAGWSIGTAPSPLCDSLNQ